MFASTYSAAELENWAISICSWAKKGRAVFIYFNNDFQAGAVENARTLSSILSKRGMMPGRSGPVLPHFRG
jgi:uncharacterized protein YecE (DUF72 family)